MRRGQFKLSFGMIFSIILIVVFITFAGYAIVKFLGIQKTVEIASFRDNLQSDVDNLQRGTQGQRTIEYYLPKKVEAVCFTDYDKPMMTNDRKEEYESLRRLRFRNENVFFFPQGSAPGIDAFELNHFDIVATTNNTNPLCFDVVNGKVEIKIRIDPGESLVKALK